MMIRFRFSRRGMGSFRELLLACVRAYENTRIRYVNICLVDAVAIVSFIGMEQEYGDGGRVVVETLDFFD